MFKLVSILYYYASNTEMAKVIEKIAGPFLIVALLTIHFQSFMDS